MEDLAKADEDLLHRLWEGLGYYNRVYRLRQFAVQVMEWHGGRIPDDRDSLMKLAGIGPYTCGAVLSFAFHKKEPAIDGNVKRVLARLMGDRRDINKQTTARDFYEKLSGILPDDIYLFNQGMIELGALVCKPKKPECVMCPVKAFCRAYSEGIVDELPVKAKKKKQRSYHLPVALIEEEGRILFIKRDGKGLLSNLWGLPIVERNVEIGDDLACISEYMHDCFGVENLEDFTVDEELIGEVKHVFSHVIWNQRVYRLRTEGLMERISGVESPELTWADPLDMSVPTAFRKSLDLLERAANE